MFAPYLSKYSCAALANILGAPGPKLEPLLSDASASFVASSNVATGGVLSLKLVARLPGAILSNPSASPQWIIPDFTMLLAWYKAVLPVEQLLLTLVIGIPVMPRLYNARWQNQAFDVYLTQASTYLTGCGITIAIPNKCRFDGIVRNACR